MRYAFENQLKQQKEYGNALSKRHNHVLIHHVNTPYFSNRAMIKMIVLLMALLLKISMGMLRMKHHITEL